jgi:DNA-binding MarR family transcriptional regulator
MTETQLSDADFERLLEFRDGLRRFLHWSEERAHEAGMTPAQHQLLLAVRGHGTGHGSGRGAGGGSGPSMSDLAGHLLLRHHSTVELVDRAEGAGLVVRATDPDDHRVVRVSLTAEGEGRLHALAEAHLQELSRTRAGFAGLWSHLPD